ncbi:sulfotransferase [Candidatus Poribacteria bacterium]
MIRIDDVQTDPERKLAFVIGCGRSGTHLVGYILRSYPEMRVTIEKTPIFDWVTAMALNPARKATLFPRLVRQYQLLRSLASPRHYADKSHPNIWLAEDLAAAFPQALFIGIQREPFATVASMLRHGGILDWHRRRGEFPVPNDFLGINTEDIEQYEQLSSPTKCALRWKSHAKKMEDLKSVLKRRLHVIGYEDLVRDSQSEIQKLVDFLGLSMPTKLPEIKTESLDRWRLELSDEICVEIERVTGLSPDNS